MKRFFIFLFIAGLFSSVGAMGKLTGLGCRLPGAIKQIQEDEGLDKECKDPSSLSDCNNKSLPV